MPTLAVTVAKALAEAPGGSLSGLAGARAELARLDTADVDGDLRAVAAHQDAGDVPLLGTTLRAGTYPALLWNGERFERLGVAWVTRLAFVARAAAPEGHEPDLAHAVGVGVAVREGWPGADPRDAAAGLTTDTVATAVCAAAASGVRDRELERVADLAAALMLVTPTQVTPGLAGLLAGHSLASGWLAVQLHGCGVLAAPGTAEEVLNTREAP